MDRRNRNKFQKRSQNNRFKRNDFPRKRNFSEFSRNDKSKKDGNNAKRWKGVNNLSEKDLGILEFINPNPGFSGIIKARFSDFHVNEIDLDDNVVQLTNMIGPKKPEEKAAEKCEEIDEEKWQSIQKMIDSDKKEDSIQLDVNELSKEKRTLIHRYLKDTYGSAIITSTIEKDEKKFIKIEKGNPKNAKDNRNKWLWPYQYTHFVMYKENIDTMKAVMALSSNLRCKTSSVAYAGTKDKRAKTSQWVCLKQYDPYKIINSVKQIPNIFVGNFCFKPETLKLGQLKGNRFRIALRHITDDETMIEKSLESLRDQGFINYYGLQRFGCCGEIPTHEIGKALLKGDFKLACELILKPRDGEPEFMTQMREFWWEKRDAAGALKFIRYSNKSIEEKLLIGLSKHGQNDYVNSLEEIPRNTRLLYIHAYQSLIWNKIVSERISKLGSKLVEGDLVFVSDETAKKGTEISADDDVEDFTDANDKEIDTPVEMEQNIVESHFKSLVRPLTKDDIASEKFSMFDLVLPLPGHDITYPSNEVGKWYEKLLEADDLNSNKLKSKVRTYSLSGAYRKVIIQPKNVSWKFVNFKNNDTNLILSDLEEIRGEVLTDLSGEHKALILDFCLPSSSYATMALREILKSDTSSSYQSQLNQDIEKIDAEKKIIPSNDVETEDADIV